MKMRVTCEGVTQEIFETPPEIPIQFFHHFPKVLIGQGPVPRSFKRFKVGSDKRQSVEDPDGRSAGKEQRLRIVRPSQDNLEAFFCGCRWDGDELRDPDNAAFISLAWDGKASHVNICFCFDWIRVSGLSEMSSENVLVGVAEGLLVMEGEPKQYFQALNAKNKERAKAKLAKGFLEALSKGKGHAYGKRMAEALEKVQAKKPTDWQDSDILDSLDRVPREILQAIADGITEGLRSEMVIPPSRNMVLEHMDVNATHATISKPLKTMGLAWV